MMELRMVIVIFVGDVVLMFILIGVLICVRLLFVRLVCLSWFSCVLCVFWLLSVLI